MSVVLKQITSMSLQSNENMELMTTLQTEQHTSKELAARLGQQEEELKDMREQVIVLSNCW